MPGVVTRTRLPTSIPEREYAWAPNVSGRAAAATSVARRGSRFRARIVHLAGRGIEPGEANIAHPDAKCNLTPNGVSGGGREPPPPSVVWRLPDLLGGHRLAALEQRLEVAEDPQPPAALARALLRAGDHRRVSGRSLQVV